MKSNPPIQDPQARFVDGAKNPPKAPKPRKMRVFVSFDVDHDVELYDLIVAQSKMPESGFCVLGASERSPATEASRERTHRRIEDADQVIVICGKHTDAAVGVFAELQLAQEEKKPYFLLWGRRSIMCTKPLGAKSSEGMYSWTPQVFEDQLELTLRNARGGAAAESLRKTGRGGQSGAAAIPTAPVAAERAQTDAG